MAKEGEPMQEDRTEDFTSMDHVNSIEARVQELLKSNEANFNAWTLLIAEVENTSPDDIQKICLVYDSFLSEFPLCYGYWTRYVGHKARLCTMNEAEQVYEQAVKIASHSVHLWVNYCNFAISSFEDPSDVRRLFERGLSYVDKDYLCHLLWDKYIKFEYCQKQWDRLAHIYINTLRFPTRRLQSYYESFKKLAVLLEEQLGSQNVTTKLPEGVPNCELTNMKGCEYTEISNVVGFPDQNPADPEALKKYLFFGELLYHKSIQLDKSISCFEAQIQRQYFHIKPLDEFQLKNWHDYLTFVEEQGSFDWTVKLYERCLIPCANYSEFWIRYVDFVDAKGGRELANDALERALKVFLKRTPAFHQYYSMYKEKIGDAVNARAPFLQISENCTADVIENICRKANMEKRMGNVEAAMEIYEKAIKMAHEKQILKILPLLYINFAQFKFVATRSVDAANEVFRKDGCFIITRVRCFSSFKHRRT
ncbi:pre-mRNA-processing factor 39-like isoform X1 [Phalaenopsis equestris]|uniref:pre-mRNA-processing factor 39-like isoform X1 n=1 Tax=Phalaenopsis equestris TaxID=78828 RepID=UPI0009E63864|nr:pre-mRNA-processing factor 39-like isoform X1 [Phalaenopsis equestris]